MLKVILIAILATVSMYASGELSILYKVEKGAKKLGYYEVNLGVANLNSKSYGAANRLEMFSTKKINYIQDGLKVISFEKSKRIQNFNVVTKISVLDKSIQKEYARKFKKVKGDDMLFITKEGSNGIELFNKRATIVKTIDEFLNDVYLKKVDYDKFILFDKLGVMKMVAEVKKEAGAVIIENYTKKKPYMKIVINNGIPTALHSMVSNWKLTSVASGVFKEYKVDLGEIISNSFSSKLKGSKVNFSKIKKSKKYYNLDGEISFALTSELVDEKPYKQNAFCKNELKKAKIKYKRLKVENSQCVANISEKSKISDLKRDILSELVKKHEQLKITKKIKFKKDSIVYEVL